MRTKLNCDTILSSKTTTIFIILYPWKNSNPHQQIRSLVCCPLHHKGIWSRVVESDHSNWFCRPGPNRSANPTLFVEISGLEPELRESKSLALTNYTIPQYPSRSGRIRTLGGIYLGGFGDRDATITPYPYYILMIRTHMSIHPTSIKFFL